MKRKVAIYARVSTEHEAQLSALDNQVQYYDNILSQNPDWELYERYIDEGITGTSTKKRKNFMRMMEDAEAGCFDLIVTREVSRFARNTVDTLQETRKLKKIGVEVYFTEDNIWTFNDEDGELKLTIMATLAQNESKKTSQRVKAGQQISFQNGVFYGTGNIMGYDKVGKDMIINEDQANVVRLIFDLFLQGKGTQTIKYELEKRGIKTATGQNTWYPSQIGKMLKNPFYCGTIVYRKQFVPDYLEQKPIKNNGQVEQVIVEGTHTPIISKEDFDKVQKIMLTHSREIENNKRVRATVPVSVWSSKLRCECGSRMNRRVYSRRNKEEVMYGYICYNQKNRGAVNKRKAKGLDTEGYCGIPQIQEWKFEIMAEFLFRKLLKDKEKIIESCNNMIDSIVSDYQINSTIEEEVLKLQNSINLNKGKLKILLDTFLNQLVDKESYIEKKNELDQLIKDAEAKLKTLKENSSPSKECIEEKVKSLKKNIVDNLNIDVNNITDKIIDSLVDRIIVHNDRFEWKINCINKISKINPALSETDRGVYFTTLRIKRNDIIRYNKKNNGILKRICQKDDIIMDIYI